MGSGGVGLVGEHCVGCGPGATGSVPLDAQMCQQDGEHWRVVGLAGPGQYHQGSAAAINELVDLGRQATTRTTYRVVDGLVIESVGDLTGSQTCRDRQILVIR